MNDKLIEKKLLWNPDWNAWAEEFVRLVKAKTEIATDVETMTGRFANAIMCWYDIPKKDKVLIDKQVLEWMVKKRDKKCELFNRSPAHRCALKWCIQDLTSLLPSE